MKCKEFDAIVTDVLRAEHTRTSTKVGDALAHATECENCGALLDAERQLTADLRGLAASQADEGASAAVEHNLMAAFRANAQQKQAQRQRFAFAWWQWGAAAAFAMLILGVYVTLNRAPKPNRNLAMKPPVQEQAVAGKPSERSMDARTPAAPVRQAKAERPRRSRTAERRSAPVQAEPVEVVTAFYALPYAAPLQPEESKRIVRVSVPQSALAALGWPVSQEQALEPVDADVLVGEDNLARAIRLVSNRGRSTQPQLRRVSARWAR